MRRALFAALVALPALAVEPWNAANSGWSAEDAHRILFSSPWAKRIAGSKATVRWESARPVQLAAERLTARLPDLGCDGCYAVAVVGFEASGTPTEGATLKTAGRAPLASTSVRRFGDTIVYVFPRREDLTRPVVVRLPFARIGNRIEFETTIGGRVVRRSFKLRTMTYQGRVEL